MRFMVILFILVNLTIFFVGLFGGYETEALFFNSEMILVGNFINPLIIKLIKNHFV